MNYKLTTNGGVIRSPDGANIPNDAMNLDWLGYLAWLSLGNVPLPADQPAPLIDYSNLDNLDKTLKAVGLVMRDYCNQLQAGTYTNKTIAQLKADFMSKYNAL